MMKWILILTMFDQNTGTSTSSQSSAITSIHGFKTQESCVLAGNAWIKQVFTKDCTYCNPNKLKALCVHE